MKKLKRVFGSVANLASGRSSDHGSGGGSATGGLSSSSRSVSGSLHDNSPQRGSYVSYETRSLDSFTSGHSSSASPSHTATHDKHFTKLHKWAAIGDTIKLKKFIKKVEVDARDSEGKTPLHHAAGAGRGDAVLFLLGSKADAEARDNMGATPLLRAVERGQIHVAQMLLQRRVDLKTADDHGQTCMHLAAHSGATELLALLLDCGGDPDAATKLGRTPLHLACAENQEETAEALLRHGADVNARDKEGVTPLMLAAKVGGVGLVENLLDHGATLTTVDASHWTAADYARFTNHNQLHHRLTTLAQHRGGDSLVPQGLLNVSDEGSDPTEVQVERKSGNEASDNGDDNSWKDDSDVSSVREKPKISLAKFLPSSDESGDGIDEQALDQASSTTGPPKPPRLYTSQSSLGSEVADTKTASACQEEASHKDEDSWKSSSEEEEPKPNLKALGMFVKNVDSDEDIRNEIKASEKFDVQSSSRVGKEDLLAELGLGSVKYESSEEDISFEEDEKPMLPLEGTPMKVVVSKVNSEVKKDSHSSLQMDENSPSLSHQPLSLSKECSPTSIHNSLSSKNPIPKHSLNESPKHHDSEVSKKHKEMDSASESFIKNSEQIISSSSRRGSIYSSPPVKSPSKRSPRKAHSQLKKPSAFDSDSDESPTPLQPHRRKSLTPSKKVGLVSTPEELPMGQLEKWSSSRSDSPSEGMKESTVTHNIKYRASVKPQNSLKCEEKSGENVRTLLVSSDESGTGAGSRNSRPGVVDASAQPARGTLSKEGTLGRQGTLQEVEEIWEANPIKSLSRQGRHSSSSSHSIETGHKVKRRSSNSQQNKAALDIARTSDEINKNSSLIDDNSRGSGIGDEWRRGRSSVNEDIKANYEQDDTAQDVTDEEFPSSGIEDLLAPKNNGEMPVLHSPQSSGKEKTYSQLCAERSRISPERKSEEPSAISTRVQSRKKSTSSPRDTVRQSRSSTVSMVNTATNMEGEYAKAVVATNLDKSLSPQRKVVLQGTVTFSDDEGDSFNLQSSMNLEGEDEVSTETEESAHINAEMKNSLLAPLSSLPDAWNVGQLRDLVRELRLKLEKEVGRRGALETALARLRHQEQQTRCLYAQQQQGLQNHQLEVNRLGNVIRQLEYQLQCQQDNGRLQEQCVEEWRERCEQLEKECHSFQAQALRQDQMVESLMLQLHTKDTMNNTLHARLQEAAAQTKYVSMKSCQTDDSLTRIVSCQSSHSQTDIVGLAVLSERIVSSPTAASLGAEQEVENIEKSKCNDQLLTETPEQGRLEVTTISVQTEEIEGFCDKLVAFQEMGIQCDRIFVTDTGIQHSLETVMKSSQTVETAMMSSKTEETVTRSSQTEEHKDSHHILTDVDGAELSMLKHLGKDSSCQAAVQSRQMAAQTDSVGLEVNGKSSDHQPGADTQVNILAAEVETLLQNFAQGIRLFISEAAQNSQTSALDGVNKAIECHLNRLNNNIEITLQQAVESRKDDTLLELRDNIHQMQNTLQYQKDIMMAISADATEIKSNNLQDVIEVVDANIKSKLDGLGKELYSIQDRHESNKHIVKSIEISLKDLKESNERFLHLVSEQLPLKNDSAVSEELDELKQHLDEHLQAVRTLVNGKGLGEDSGVSVSRGMLERLDTIEKSLSLSLGKNCTTEDISDLQVGVRQLSQDLDRKILCLEEGLTAVNEKQRPEVMAVEEQLRGLRESTEGMMKALKMGASEQNTRLSEALEENFQIVSEQVRRLQQTLLHKINEVAEHVNVAEDQHGTRLARQVAEVAQQVAVVQSGVMRVQAWVDRAENTPPGDTLDHALVSSLRANSDHTLATLTQQNHSILKQLEGLQQNLQQGSQQGQQTKQTLDPSTELIHLREELRKKDVSLASLQSDLKDLQDTLSNQKKRAETFQHEAKEQHGLADHLMERAKLQESEVKERQEAAKQEAARNAKDMAHLQQENIRLATEVARITASLEVEQQQRHWCEVQLQALQDARNAAEKRTTDLLAALPPPSLHRTPPTGRDQQEDEAVIRQQQVYKQEIEKVRAENLKVENNLTEQQGRVEHLNLQLREAQASLALEQQEKADLEKQLKKTRETLTRLQQDLNEARQQQEMNSNLEDLKRELEGEVLAKETSMEVLKGKIETLSKEKLQLKQDLLTLRGEKLSHDLLRQEKQFSEEMQRKTEEQLYDLQKKIPIDYVARASVVLMQKELESKYQQELTTKLAELQRSLDDQRKHHESLIRGRDAREHQLREEINRKSEEIVRLSARLSLGEEREDSWRVRHDRLLSLYQQVTPHHATPDITPASSYNIVDAMPVTMHNSPPKTSAEDSLALTLKEINQHLKTPLVTSALLDQLTPPPDLHIGVIRSGGVGGGSVDSYHHTHAHSLDRTINKYLSQSDRFFVAEDKPQARISPMQPSPAGALPTLDQSCQEYVDLLKKRYGL